jgi:hypothetical protein
MTSVNLQGKNLKRLTMPTSGPVARLDVSFNVMTSLDGDVLAALAGDLRSLDASGNRLTELPHELGHLTNLRQLLINGNQLSTIAPEIGNLKKLQVLSASNNQIEALPRHIGRLRELTELRLDGNHLKSVLLDLGELRQLQVLDLSNCNLQQLPEQICYCGSLIELSLGNNRLASLPVSIGRLTRLAMLDVSQNRLHDLPLSMGRCVGLECVGARLDLTGNPLTNATLAEKATLGTDHVFRFLANRMGAVGDVELFTMKKSTISRKGHTIKMTTREPGAKKARAKRAPPQQNGGRRDASADDVAAKRQRLFAAALAVCSDELLPTLYASKKRAQAGPREHVVASAHLAKAIQGEVRDAFELVSLPFIPHDPSGRAGGDGEAAKLERLRSATDALLFDALSAVKALQKHIGDESLDNEHRMRCVQTARNIRSLVPGDQLVSRDSARSGHSSGGGSSTGALLLAGLAAVCAIAAIVVLFAVGAVSPDVYIGVVLGLSLVALVGAGLAVVLRRRRGVALSLGVVVALLGLAAIVVVALSKSGTIV